MISDEKTTSLTRIAVLGAGGGLRSFAPAAVLAAQGAGPFPAPARFIAWGAAAGEIIADKQPGMGSRWARRGLTLRLGSCLLAGHELAGVRGAAVCASVALTTAYAASRLRVRVPAGARARIASGAVEDVLSYALVAAATA